jgi:hypothetical protein
MPTKAPHGKLVGIILDGELIKQVSDELSHNIISIPKMRIEPHNTCMYHTTIAAITNCYEVG